MILLSAPLLITMRTCAVAYTGTGQSTASAITDAGAGTFHFAKVMQSLLEHVPIEGLKAVEFLGLGHGLVL